MFGQSDHLSPSCSKILKVTLQPATLLFSVKAASKLGTEQPRFPAPGERARLNAALLKAAQVSQLCPVATPVGSGFFCAAFCALPITKLHEPSALSAAGIWALRKQRDKSHSAGSRMTLSTKQNKYSMEMP